MKLPHADLDIAEQSAAELRVPFYSPLRFLETPKLQTASYLGFMGITDPFASIFADNSSIVKVYFWIEDVELLYPTNLFSTSGGKENEDLIWTPQGPEKEDVKGGQVVLSQPYYDSNYQVSAQAVPYCMNVVSKSYSQGSTTRFDELFKTTDFLQVMDLTKTATSEPFTYWVAPASTRNPQAKYARSGLLSLFFYMYSGSMDFSLKIIKNKFHSGRLQVAFLPLWGTRAIPTNLDDFWNIVWDFRENSTLDFSVPFVDNKFMTLTDPTNAVGQGILVFKQITPLQSPDNVAQNIKLVLTGRMSDDLQFACPKPLINQAYKPGTLKQEHTGDAWSPQGPINDKPSPTPTNYVNEGSCSLREYASKFTANNSISGFHSANGIVFPASLYGGQATYSSTAGSGTMFLCNIFEFYRGDLVGKSPTAGPVALPVYYADLDDNDSEFPVVPYISNLRYNSVYPVASTLPAFDQKFRLHNAEFFYPWYSLKAYA
jgi:hypothetical protein